MVRKLRKTDKIKHFYSTLAAFCLAFVYYLKRKLDVLYHSSPVVQHCTLEHHSVLALQTGFFRGFTAYQHFTGGRLQKVSDYAQKRCLAAARRSEQRDELAFLYIHCNACERLYFLAVCRIVCHSDIVKHNFCIFYSFNIHTRSPSDLCKKRTTALTPLSSCFLCFNYIKPFSGCQRERKFM